MKTVLITGGSSGIGLALAKVFAADGYRLILCAQDETRLQQAAAALPHSDEHTYIVQDLAQLGGAEKLVANMNERELHADILVNCAGFGTSGPFIETDLLRETQEMQLNMVALTQLTKLVLPRMVAAGEGHIINVASIAAFMPGPYMAVYYASKAYVLRFGDALHEELRGSGVGVITLCPGPTATGFAAAAGAAESKAFRGTLPTADDIAQAAYRGFKRGKRLVIPGWKFKALHIIVQFLPQWLIARFVAGVQRPQSESK